MDLYKNYGYDQVTWTSKYLLMYHKQKFMNIQSYMIKKEGTGNNQSPWKLNTDINLVADHLSCTDTFSTPKTFTMFL